MDDRAGLGRDGEREAVRFLRRHRYRIVTRNYRCPLGEIDVVVLDGPTIVFVEVKTRSGRELGDPEEAVNPAKQERLCRAARFFLRQTRSEGRACRFDIVAVIAGADEPMSVEHIPDAFAPRR